MVFRGDQYAGIQGSSWTNRGKLENSAQNHKVGCFVLNAVATIKCQSHNSQHNTKSWLCQLTIIYAQVNRIFDEYFYSAVPATVSGELSIPLEQLEKKIH